MADGQSAGSGGSGSNYFEPFPTQDYGVYGPAMTFREHDAVQRRLRDMVDDEGVPKQTDPYVIGAADKGFLQPLLQVPAGYGTLTYDNGKEGMYTHV